MASRGSDGRSGYKALLVLALGAAIGSAGTWWWLGTSEWRADQSAVELAGVVDETAFDESSRHLTLTVRLHNFGDRPVDVRRILVKAPGVEPRAAQREGAWVDRRIAPGAAAAVRLGLLVTCRLEGTEQSSAVWVRTSDRPERRLVLNLTLDDIGNGVRRMCWSDSADPPRIRRLGTDVPRIGRAGLG